MAFLLCYALLALRRAVRPEALEAGESGAGTSLKAALTTAAALTFLNPHVYLDTVLLLGSIANQHGDDGRWVFAVGRRRPASRGSSVSGTAPAGSRHSLRTRWRGGCWTDSSPSVMTLIALEPRSRLILPRLRV